MKTIETGKTPITLATLVAILSLSLVVNLPGLAITPMLETLEKIFPNASQLEVQLLTMLPNVLIIPFVLLSGKISESKHKFAVVAGGLVIFTASAVAYLFAGSMAELIIISCLLGAGAGILVPFSTGLLADTFSGVYKMKEMGVQSGVANLTLVVATFVVGWLQHGNWHLPFLVYLVAVIPLVLSPLLRKIPQNDVNVTSQQMDTDPVAQVEDQGVKFNKDGFSISRTISLFAAYASMTFLVIVISYYTPFLANKYGWSESLTGTVTSLYFLFIFLPGFFLSPIVKAFKKQTAMISCACITVGLLLFVAAPTPFTLCLGGSLAGFGYGVLQPIFYDKATRIVNKPSRSTLALAIILSANYIAIVVAPFIIDAVRSCFGGFDKGGFAFLMNLVLSIVFWVVAIINRKGFAFAIPESYYRD